MLVVCQRSYVQEVVGSKSVRGENGLGLFFCQIAVLEHSGEFVPANETLSLALDQDLLESVIIILNQSDEVRLPVLYRKDIAVLKEFSQLGLFVGSYVVELFQVGHKLGRQALVNEFTIDVIGKLGCRSL
jgi:hypothetical protein